MPHDRSHPTSPPLRLPRCAHPAPGLARRGDARRGAGRRHAAPRRRPAGGDRRRSAEPRPPPGEHVRQHRAGGPALQHPAAARSLQLSQDHRRPRHRVEDLAGRAHLHLQAPSGREVPRRLPAHVGRRQGQLRQDHLPAAGRPQRAEERLHRGHPRRGPRPHHGGVQAEVPVGVAPGQPGLALERDLPEEVPRPGPQLLQDPRDRLRALQVQGLHPGLHLRGRAQPRLLREGSPVPRRLQVLHQPGDLGAGGRHPLGARLHRVPEPAQRGGRRHPQAARGQGRGPGDPDDRRVGHRDQQHQEAVRRRARPQGALPRHRSLHDGQGALSPHRAPLRGRPDAAGLGVGDAGGRAREAPGLRTGHREEPGRGEEAPRRGRLSQRASSSC